MKISYIPSVILITVLVLCFVPSLNGQVTDTIKVEAGWNFLSLPVKVADGTKSVLFPSAVSDAFVFNGSYISKNNLENGEGFWLKFDSKDTFFITGEPIAIDTINVRKGWNMIGSLTIPIMQTSTWSEPYGIRTSGFYHYGSGSYCMLDTIKPGWGYWVQVIQDGKIILSSIGSPCSGIPTVEYEGKTYNTVQIGSQCWLKENLDIGTMINGADTSKDNGIIEKYCYNDSIENCNTYGGLYQWNEAMQYTITLGARGICSSGWHIPTLEEFVTLGNTVGGDGNALKEIGRGTGDGAGTNTSGFSALLAGYRIYDGFFYNLSYYASFWSSTEYGPYAYYMTLLYNSSFIYLYYFTYKDYGFSVRCLQD